MKKRGFKAIAVAVVLLAAVVGCGKNGENVSENTDNYPTKDITVIVPFPAGAGTDIAGRTFLKELNKQMPDTNFVVKNVTGASGTVGANELLNSKADGYTLMIAGGALESASAMGIYDKSYEDYAVISQFITSDLCLVVNANSEYQTFEDLIIAAKEHPGEVKMGVSMGTVLHFAALSIAEETDAAFKYISIGGEQPMPPELISNRIDCYVTAVSQALPYIESGDFRSVGVFGEEPVALLEEVPNFIDMGITNNFEQYFGLYAPGGCPQEVVDKLSKMTETVCDSEEYQKQMDDLGYHASYKNAEDYALLLKESSEVMNSLADKAK